MKFSVILFLALLAMPACAADLVAKHVVLHDFDHGQELMFVEALDRIGRGQLDGALAELQQLVIDNPSFRLAQLVYADLLLAKSRPIGDFGNVPSAAYGQIQALRDEAQARWRHYRAPSPAGLVPASLVKLSDDQRYAIVVNMSTSRLYLFENRSGVPELVLDFYATIGKNGMGKGSEGDQKTPVGVYFVTGFIGSGQLPDFYGDGAYPIDYPNVWDQRHGRTGYGIWLHGTPHDTFSRPPRDSDGCVILSNRDLNALAQYVEPGRTPVILTAGIQWLARAEWQRRRGALENVVEQWRRDWESRDADLYLSHYSPGYSGLGKDYSAWVDYKRRVTSSKRFIRVGISAQSMFLYPGEDEVLVVTFEQDYTSDNLRRVFVKRQYWQREEDGKWRIVYEGSMS
ncbi:MAG: L,D-transpeptidase family protein [Gammaproteobacteria bacterium]|nr:L,D-transpeptidase family protein [Gammaproteobacteria bacterium]